MNIGGIGSSTGGFSIGGIRNSSSVSDIQQTGEIQREEGANVDGLQKHSMKSGDVSKEVLHISEKLVGGVEKVLPVVSSVLAKCTVGAGDFLLNNGGAIIGVVGKVCNFAIETVTKLVIAIAKICTGTFWI